MKNTITRFYEAFNNLDADTMCSFYHNDIVFEDPAFGILKGERAKAMWQMLCNSQRGKNFRVEASNINDNSAHWEAYYKFSKTGRKVHNKIDAKFEFKDGLIIKHTDNFNLHQWAKQALGFKGLLLGGTRFFKNKLLIQTNTLLNKYIAEKKLSV
ncbi:nuclear transport factor 2 family protein [Winogradskyella sp.]|jgi:ketosteroid isomerase-like protein|uniref:nuclear transport factor 2 family protein n=1 Tax=Winogradskyella sp. TaxID=1883156 RepID=UPI0025D3234F|nr:nuclear transport factor 2 family protein [Winogradskyella sp.]MCT4629671.1 nuclear transport factor 2 family protein [Winogradskyella sp.]